VGASRADSAAKILGRRVRDRRHELDLTIEQLAERTGLHWTYIGSLERGERKNPTLLTILRVARALKVDPGELVTGLKAT
jgi:transcriptional regulator with XRE-family HTH domain